jgi:methionyl-tRNA formyltransferase
VTGHSGSGGPAGASGLSIVFVGCVGEGYVSLEHLLRRGERVQCVFTLQDDLAAGISGAARFDDLAARFSVPLIKVRSINDAPHVERIRALAPDLVLVIGWTQLVKPPLLAIPRYGCIGFHASLLPRYRGRAPVNWAIINGETKTGNTMILLEEGVDSGDIIAQREIAIGLDDTCATIYDRVAESEREMLDEVLPLIRAGRMPRRRQDARLATVMPRRRPQDGFVDWSRTTLELHNWVRALTHPYPGAFTFLGDRRVFIWKATPDASGAALPPGEAGLVGGRLLAGTADGALSLERLQAEHEKELSGTEFAARHLASGRLRFHLHPGGPA